MKTIWGRMTAEEVVDGGRGSMQRDEDQRWVYMSQRVVGADE